MKWSNSSWTYLYLIPYQAILINYGYDMSWHSVPQKQGIPKMVGSKLFTALNMLHVYISCAHLMAIAQQHFTFHQKRPLHLFGLFVRSHEPMSTRHCLFHRIFYPRQRNSCSFYDKGPLIKCRARAQTFFRCP